VRSVHYGSGQRFWRGVAHPQELPHDVALYRMFHAEAEALRTRGMKVRRVVLDHELKGRVWGDVQGRELARAEKKNAAVSKREYDKMREEAAAANGLTIVNGSIQFPDLRIEYEQPDGDIGRIDLELTTPHYRTAQISAKRAAGMKIYGLTTPTWGSMHDPKIAAKAFEL
jgi:hypothetical protein